MNRPRAPHALFYPFHLCHHETLAQLLARFATVHFRDFMALQLTPMSGMTAFQDRMGMSFPDLVDSGRLVQGYDVSGLLSPALAAAIDRDLRDPLWRARFHQALRRDRPFGVHAFTKRFAGTDAFNVDCSSHPTVFVSATVSCQAPPHSYASWTIRLDCRPMLSIR